MKGVVIVGLPQALAKIAAIPVVAETVGQAALDAGKELVVGDARARAPRRTGALAASITATPDGVGVAVPYAGFVEFGTRNMRAEAYLIPALNDQADRVSDLVGTTVKTALYAL